MKMAEQNREKRELDTRATSEWLARFIISTFSVFH